MNWIDLAINKERWWTLVNVVVMNISVPHNAWNLTGEGLLASQEELLHGVN
jgi:hypothetical protein